MDRKTISQHLCFLFAMNSIVCLVFSIGRALSTAVDMQVALFIVWTVVFAELSKRAFIWGKSHSK